MSEENWMALQADLAQFLRWKRATDLEDLVQETLFRVFEKLAAGERIENLRAFARRVAELVHLEHLRMVRREFAMSVIMSPGADANLERLFRCLEECKKKCLTRRERTFIERYYESGAKERKLLARSRGITEAQLRKQAMEVRRKLQRCVEDCMRDSQA
jgi:DNA-directed RNA polymerase specialized sigma24 family protein